MGYKIIFAKHKKTEHSRLLLVISLALLLLLSIAFNPYERRVDAAGEFCAAPPTGFDAHWDLENSTDDISGNGHDLQFGSVTYSTDSTRGVTSASFNGSSDFLTYHDGTFLNQELANFSYSFWVKPNILSGVQTLLDEGGTTNGIAIRLNGNTLESSVREGGASSQVSTSSFTFPSDGQWHHVALTYSNGDVTMYLDSVPSSTLNTGFGGLAAHSDSHNFGRTSAGDSFGAAPGNYYDGLMDEILHYPSVLSQADINSLSCNGTGFVLSQTTLTVDENGGTDTFEVVLDTPPATDVVIDLNSDDTNEATVAPAQLTFTSANWNVPQTVTVTGVDDTMPFDDTATITASINDALSDNLFDPLPDKTVTVTLTNVETVHPGGVGDGLTLWYNADNGVTGSSNINNWDDLSGNNYNCTRNTPGANGPSLIPNDFNFNPSTSFNGTSEYCAIKTLNYQGSEEIEDLAVYVVFKTDFSSGSYSSNWAFLDFDRSDYFNFYLRGDSKLGASYRGSKIRDIAGTTAGLNNDQPQLGTFIYDGALLNDSVLRQNGSTDYQANLEGTGSGLGTNNQRYGFIGDGSEATAFDGSRNNIYYDGEIAEIVYYSNNAQTATETSQIESYLALKYGITLDQTNGTDYLASDGSTKMWDKDFATASTYNNDIAGIGRDDTSALGQIISKSENTDAVVTILAEGESTDDSNTLANYNFTDLNNLEFLSWGNDNGALATTNTGSPPGVALRTQRIWQAQETGEVGTTSIKFNLNTVGMSGQTAAGFVLLTDTDTNFTDATQTVATQIVGDEVIFTGVNLNDGNYFTLAALPPTIGDLVWADYNANGVFDSATEVGLDNVTIGLYLDDGANPGTYDGDETLHLQTTTGADGAYSFVGLTPQKYWVVVTDDNDVLNNAAQTSANTLPELIDATPGLIYTAADYGFGVYTASITKLTDGAEPGADATFNVSLDRINASGGDLTLDYSFSGGTATAGTDYDNSTTSVTIPNGQQNATLTIPVIDDSISEGDETVEITLTGATSPVSIENDGTQKAVAIITDDDTAGFTISKTTSTIDEDAGTDTFTVVLDAQPISDVVIDIFSNDTNEATASPNSLTFTNANWNTPQTVTITGVDDNIVANNSATITVDVNDGSSDLVFSNLADQTVDVNLTDDDTAGFTISKTTSTLDEDGGTDTFTAVLNSEPTSDVVIDLSSNYTNEATIAPSSLTFTNANWNTPQTVTITGVNDNTVANNTAIITVSINDASSDDTYDPLVDQTVTVTLTDDDIDTDGDSIIDSIDTDDDNDGTLDFIEVAGFNNGDGNGDGIIDSKQDSVSAVPNPVTGEYSTLEASGDCGSITKTQFVPESSLATLDNAGDYPLGLVDFQVVCANPGDSADITIYYTKQYDTSAWAYKKYNSINKSYAEITDLVTFSTATVGGVEVTKTSFTVTDGDHRTDEDKTADGVINDPSGPALSTEDLVVVDLASTGISVYLYILSGLGLFMTGVALRRFKH